jgi:hypothetical protein
MARQYLSSDPKKYAQRVLKDIGLRPPVPVGPVLDYFGLKQYYLERGVLENQGVSAIHPDLINSFLVNERDTASIYVFKEMSPQRIRMSIFHEIGHFDMPWHDAYAYACSINEWRPLKREVEREAFAYAAEIMMPLCESAPYIHESPFEVDFIQQFASDFDASFEAASIHYVRHSEKACALIHIVPNMSSSDSGRLFRTKYVFRSKKFPSELPNHCEIENTHFINDFIDGGGWRFGELSAGDFCLGQKWTAKCELKYHGKGKALALLTIPDYQTHFYKKLED